MRHMRAIINIPLPDDEFAEADVKLKIKPIWDAFLTALIGVDVTNATAKLETTWVRNKPAATAGTKRGRKPRVAVVPKLADAPAEAPEGVA